MGSRPAAGRVKGARKGHRKGSKMRRTWKGISRRGFVLGTAAAAVMAGLAACDGGVAQAPATTEESVAPTPVTEGEIYYKSDYDYSLEGEQKLVADQAAFFHRTVHEGTVLLRNEGAALPLSPEDGKVTAFGNAGPRFMTGLDAAMKDEGFTFDDVAWEFYKEGPQNSNSWEVNENPWADVEAAPFFPNLGGVAIVFLGRTCHEGCDAQWYEDHDYLALSQEEKDMLSGVAELRRSGTFSKMIVSLSMSNTVSWEDGPWSDAIDAILWDGNVSFTNYEKALPLGGAAFAEILSGAANPSGRMPDTIYKNNRLNPVMANFGRIDADLSRVSAEKIEEITRTYDEWKPGNDIGHHWRRNYVYAEGIYVGYRYAETRYEDKVLGQGNAGDFDYAAYVAYPFGHGLSYTTFSFSDLSLEEADDSFTVSVTVTNTGGMAGKVSVPVYVQSPYTDYDRENGVEKASVELKGYEKTQDLEPGASEQVSVVIARKELASFDANGAKTYVLDAGDYYFTVANSAHEAVNNILAAKGKTVADGMTADGDQSMVMVWSNPDFDAESCAVSVSGKEITTLFDEWDPNKNSMVGSLNNVTWLSRSDWEGTLPKQASSVVYTEELADLALPFTYQAGSGDASSVPAHEFGKTENDVMLVDMHGKDYDDPDWEKLVSKLTYEEMVDFIINSENPTPIVGKPGTESRDGSLGWGGSSGDACVASGLTIDQWPTKDTVAATFSTEINEGIGRFAGEDMLHSSTRNVRNVSLLGWSCGTHRAPYSGRNLEYFSEDPYLGGRSCAEETRGVQEKGGLVYLKHVVGNDQEEFRHAVTSWGNEQSMREIYLRQFEKAVVEGNATGLMTSFNRLGMTWAGESHELLREFLEGELGYTGTTITDNFEGSFMDAVDGLINGNHLWLFAGNYEHNVVCNDVLLQDDYKSDPIIQDALFEAVHRALYNFANSSAVNGLTHDSTFGVDSPLLVSSSQDGLAPTSFYGDKNFVADYKKPRERMRGTWDYSDENGLTLTALDGTVIEVTSENGLFTWSVPIAGQEIANTVSAYELATACNENFGESFSTGEQPAYALTFVAGSDDVSGEDPAEVAINRGVEVTLPECPYSGEHLEFLGWTIGGETYEAGVEYVPDAYADVKAEGTWGVKVLAAAETLDDYRYTYMQASGVPLALYADGTLELGKSGSGFYAGSWEVAGSGSGVASLTLLNESGVAVDAKAEDGKLVYAQEGFINDWHQPDRGYGSGVFKANLIHRVDLSEFITAYNEEFGTSYDSVDVKGGSSAFGEQVTED